MRRLFGFTVVLVTSDSCALVHHVSQTSHSSKVFQGYSHPSSGSWFRESCTPGPCAKHMSPPHMFLTMASIARPASVCWCRVAEWSNSRARSNERISACFNILSLQVPRIPTAHHPTSGSGKYSRLLCFVDVLPGEVLPRRVHGRPATPRVRPLDAHRVREEPRCALLLREAGGWRCLRSV